MRYRQIGSLLQAPANPRETQLKHARFPGTAGEWRPRAASPAWLQAFLRSSLAVLVFIVYGWLAIAGRQIGIALPGNACEASASHSDGSRASRLALDPLPRFLNGAPVPGGHSGGFHLRISACIGGGPLCAAGEVCFREFALIRHKQV